MFVIQNLSRRDLVLSRHRPPHAGLKARSEHPARPQELDLIRRKPHPAASPPSIRASRSETTLDPRPRRDGGGIGREGPPLANDPFPALKSGAQRGKRRVQSDGGKCPTQSPDHPARAHHRNFARTPISNSKTIITVSGTAKRFFYFVNGKP